MMQAESHGFGALTDYDDDALIPVEMLGDVPSKRLVSGVDSASIVELGKQLLACAKEGDTEMVRDLMCRGAPFTTDWLGTSALHMSAQNNHTETAEVLLRAGISRDARTKVDRTPLHMAAYEGHAEMTRLLLNYGADVDARDMLKMTPLHWAVEQEHIDVLNILLDFGADPNLVSKFNKTALNLAVEHDRMDIVDLLQQERDVINPKQNHNFQENESATHHLILSEGENQRRVEDSDRNSNNKRPRMVFQKVDDLIDKNHKVDNHLKEKKIKTEEPITITHQPHRVHKDISHLVDQPLKFLQAHGITMIPMEDDSSIVENAMESGQTVVLTEAGKLALNLTRSPPGANQVKKVQVATKKVARNVIHVRPEQILHHISSPSMSKTPNILKRNSTVDTKNNMNKFIITPTSNSTSVTASIEINPLNAKKIIMNKGANSPVIYKLEDDPIAEDPHEAINILLAQKKVTDTKKQVEDLRRQLREKEQELEVHQRSLNKIMSRQRLSK